MEVNIAQSVSSSSSMSEYSFGKGSKEEVKSNCFSLKNESEIVDNEDL